MPRSALYDARARARALRAARATRSATAIYQLLLDLDELDELARESRSSRSTGATSSRCAPPTTSATRGSRSATTCAPGSTRAGVDRARRPHRAAHARAHVRVRLQPGLLLLRARPRRRARVRRRRGAQHVRRALALPAGRPGRARRRRAHALRAPRSASTSRRSWTSSGTYRFLLGEPGERLMMRIDEQRDGERLFRAVLTGERRPLTDRRARARARALPAGSPGRSWRASTGRRCSSGASACRSTASRRSTPSADRCRHEPRRARDASRRAGARRPGRSARSRGACSSARSAASRTARSSCARPTASRRFGDPAREPVVFEVHDPRWFARLARSGRLAVGRGLPGRRVVVARPAGPRGAARAQPGAGLRPPAALAAARGSGASCRASSCRAGCAAPSATSTRHYDLGNAFFSLWLDDSMTYSCALFETPEATLAEAQQAKYRALADATLIGPGDHVLEIGSGWGGFALHLARERGCRVTTATISREQHELATRARAGGRPGRPHRRRLQRLPAAARAATAASSRSR